jgi:hypothetical protein
MDGTNGFKPNNCKDLEAGLRAILRPCSDGSLADDKHAMIRASSSPARAISHLEEPLLLQAQVVTRSRTRLPPFHIRKMEAQIPEPAPMEVIR